MDLGLFIMQPKYIHCQLMLLRCTASKCCHLTKSIGNVHTPKIKLAWGNVHSHIQVTFNTSDREGERWTMQCFCRYATLVHEAPGFPHTDFTWAVYSTFTQAADS